MTLSRILKKAFIVSFIAFSSILLLCSIWVYTNRDTVIDKFVTEANKYLNTPVEVGKITLSIFETFPLIKIELEDVHITGSLPEEDSKPLLTAKRIEVLLDPFAVLDGNLSIKGVRLLNATCSMIVQSDGTTNYQIFKKKDSAVKSKMDFELSSVLLKDINYYYQNDGSKLRMHTVAKSAKANLILEGGTYYIKSDGQYTISSIMVKQREYVSNKSLDGNISITYQTDLKSVKIEKSIVKIDGSRFLTDVTYSFQEKIPYINLSLEGEQTSIETIFNLLPARISKNFKRYKSRGSAFFSLRLEGQIRHKTGPQLAIDFGLENAEISYPNSALTIEGVSTKGLFLAEDILNLSTGTLEMTDIRGKFENKDFMSELVYKDFHNPHLTLAFDGAFELSSLSKLADISQIEDASGSMNIALKFNGDLNHLKNKASVNKIETDGQIEMDNISFKHQSLKLPVQELSGTLLFNHSDIALSNVQGFYGSSDFLLNGLFKNLFANVLFDNEPLGIEANLKSEFIDLNELLMNEDSSDSEAYLFKLSPKLRLKFECEVSKLAFRRFNPHNINGTILIKDQQLQTDKIEFEGMGGQITLNGYVNTAKENTIYSDTNIVLQEVQLDSIFYVFENFDQSFIKNSHLKGSIDATIHSEMELDSLLNLNSRSLQSEVNLSINGGELNNFQPLQQLSKYLDESQLKALRFSDISTDILIQDKTVYIPEIELQTNVTNLTISGTHTFDQHIDYRIATPLRRNEKIDKDEAFGAIEESGGESTLFLKIAGTTNEYTISYDKTEVKKKIISDLKKEVQELKQAFKNKGLKKTKKVELEEDDYFDW